MALKAFVGNMDKFFSNRTASPNSPPRNKAGGAEEADDRAASQPATKAWVKTGLTAALEAMGDAVEERICKTEKDVEVKTAAINRRLDEPVRGRLGEPLRASTQECPGIFHSK